MRYANISPPRLQNADRVEPTRGVGGPEGNGADHAASPVFHLNDPRPFLIAYGEKDFPHLILQAEEMIGALRQAGASVETMRFPGRDHFTASLAGGERDGPWVPRALAFIRSRKRE